MDKSLFTVENIKRVLDKHEDLKLAYGTFFNSESYCACPLTLLAIDKSEASLSVLMGMDREGAIDMGTLAHHKLGMKLNELTSFWHGFDKIVGCSYSNKELYKIGFELREEFDEKYPGLVKHYSDYAV